MPDVVNFFVSSPVTSDSGSRMSSVPSARIDILSVFSLLQMTLLASPLAAMTTSVLSSIQAWV